MPYDDDYLKRRKAVETHFAANPHATFKIKKRTTSNLFRYQDRHNKQATDIDLTAFNHVLAIDTEAQTLDVEGLATFEAITKATLTVSLAPQVTPELKNITIGGAIVGIGIESNCHHFGFVHDSLLEADVLLPNGSIVHATANNKQADLFAALPNSYGTLGYVLRAKIKLHKIKPFVKIKVTEFDESGDFLAAMQQATKDRNIDFIESLIYRPNKLFLVCSQMVDTGQNLTTIYGRRPFYSTLSQPTTRYLTIQDYLFRYDPDWFWNIPESWPYQLFRLLAPKRLRHSGFYKRYIQIKGKLCKTWPFSLTVNQHEEQLIQDWEIPWNKAQYFLDYALNTVDLDGKPWIATPIIPQSSPSLYPVTKHKLYFNLGCYCYITRPKGQEKFHSTKQLDAKCYLLGGIKMLYSSTFLDQASFANIYNGKTYHALKQKYDPQGNMPTLFAKTVQYK